MDTGSDPVEQSAGRFPGIVLAAVAGYVALAGALAVGIVVVISYELIPFLLVPACMLIATVPSVVGLLRRSARGVHYAVTLAQWVSFVLVLVGGFVTVGLFIEPGDPLLAGGVGLAVAAALALLVALRRLALRCRGLTIRP